MAFARIELVLDKLGWEGEYLENFVENKIDDKTLDCLKENNSFALACLRNTIPAEGHRIQFLMMFGSLSGNAAPNDNHTPAALVEGKRRCTNESVSGESAAKRIKTEQDCDEEVSPVSGKDQDRAINLDSEQLAFLTSMKDAYVKEMKKAVVDIEEEDELRKIQSKVKRATVNDLKREAEARYSSPQLITDMVGNLKEFIFAEFKGTLQLLRMKKLEGTLAVKTALADARAYYQEEMEKNLKEAKNGLQTEELQQLHEEKRDAAIKKSKEDIELNDRQERQLRDIINLIYKKFEDKNRLKAIPDSKAIGIDLGTTYSCVAVCIRGKVEVIPCDGKPTVPSYVAFNHDHTVSVGEAAKEKAFRHPEYTIFDAKRLVGRKYYDTVVQEDINLWPFEVQSCKGHPKITIPDNDKRYRPEEISAYVLSYLKTLAEEYLNSKITNAVITVPAYFNDSQRKATKVAAKIAGLDSKILNEPTSAAIAYHYESYLTNDLKRNVLIFDLGGGTFDVAVLEMKSGRIEVKAIGGDTHLGGEDFDNEMVKHVIETFKQKKGVDLARGRDSRVTEMRRKANERLRRIRSACEKHKRIISYSKTTTITIERIDGNYDLVEPFSREEFERINMSKFKKCIEITDQVISDAKILKSEIDDIVLIGGSTRIPKIREMLTEYFDGKSLNSQIKADEAVAFGAAIHAALEYCEANNEAPISPQVSVSDVTPFSLGTDVEVDRFSNKFCMSIIIPKNTPVPCCKTENYCTARDGQTEIGVAVYEGEKDDVKHNNWLGEFTLKGIPSAPAEEEWVDVTMSINNEGILHVGAISQSTGESDSIQIDTREACMSEAEVVSAKNSVRDLKW